MEHIALPSPTNTGSISLEEALNLRRSIREFDGTPLSAEQLSQLLWAAHGIIDADGRRTAPSAGTLTIRSAVCVTPSRCRSSIRSR